MTTDYRHCLRWQQPLPQIAAATATSADRHRHCCRAQQNNYSALHVPQNVNACPTLFVANLGPTCSEQELIQVFSRCHGFIKLKMQSTYGTPVAFVDFQILCYCH
ncbi:hypothetical protein CsSME_00038992 [Camellia sinensis var. sinensis]